MVVDSSVSDLHEGSDRCWFRGGDGRVCSDEKILDVPSVRVDQPRSRPRCHVDVERQRPSDEEQLLNNGTEEGSFRRVGKGVGFQRRRVGFRALLVKSEPFVVRDWLDKSEEVVGMGEEVVDELKYETSSTGEGSDDGDGSSEARGGLEGSCDGEEEGGNGVELLELGRGDGLT